MKTWSVHGQVSAGRFVGTVEAETKEEAEKAAWKELDMGVYLCHQCADQAEDAAVTEIVVEEDKA